MEQARHHGAGGTVLSFDARAVRKLLPHRYPFMLLDRVQGYHCREKKLVGIKHVSRNEPFLRGHFPEFPVFPGTLIIEALVQASACLMVFDELLEGGTPAAQLPGVVETIAATPSFLAESRVRHLRPVFPGVQMELECQLTRRSGGRYSFRSCARVEGEEVTRGQVTLARSLEPGEESGHAAQGGRGERRAASGEESDQPLRSPLAARRSSQPPLAFRPSVVHRVLPLRAPIALLDSVESYWIAERKLVGIKEVTRNEPVLEGHFPEEPVFPGSLVIEALAQACGMLFVLEHLRERAPRPELLADEELLRSLLPPPACVLADSKIEQLALVRPGERMKLEAQLILQRTDVHYFEVRALLNDAAVAAGTVMLAGIAYPL